MPDTGFNRSTFGEAFLSFEQDLFADEFGIIVTYKRDADTIENIRAMMGEVLTVYDDRTGIDIALGDGSLWLLATDIDFGNGPFQPAKHDQLITAKGDVYEVLAPGEMDAEKIMIQIPVTLSLYATPEAGS